MKLRYIPSEESQSPNSWGLGLFINDYIIIIFKQKLCENEYSLFLLGISETWHGLFLYQKDIVSEIKPRKMGWKRP